MQGDKAIIKLLNAVLTNELTAVNQYFLHARMYENWGFKRLGKITYDESIGEHVPECLAADLSVETAGRAMLVPGIKQCEEAQDYVSRELLTEILEDTEEHIDFLETQLSLVKSLGEQNYLQSALGELEGE